MLCRERAWALAFVLSGLAAPLAAGAATFEAGLLLGTHGGPGGTAQLTVAEFSPNLNWQARIGATYSAGDPGRPVGADYYLSSGLKGHDTTYTPDDENVNPRKDFTYEDADDAINQPKLEVRAMAGIVVRLGR